MLSLSVSLDPRLCLTVSLSLCLCLSLSMSVSPLPPSPSFFNEVSRDRVDDEVFDRLEDGVRVLVCVDDLNKGMKE